MNDPQCKYRIVLDDGRNHCRIGKFGGYPSIGVCHYCLSSGRKPNGLGDTIARILHPVVAFAVETWRGRSRWHLGEAYLGFVCGCVVRQAWLNRACPYGQWGPLTPLVQWWKGA